VSANVRCAGLPVETRQREAPTDYDELPPCGWEGERPRTIVDLDDGGWHPDLATPCPNCGGRVEQIPQEPGP
jgi:hypothetical protein